MRGAMGGGPGAGKGRGRGEDGSREMQAVLGRVKGRVGEEETKGVDVMKQLHAEAPCFCASFDILHSLSAYVELASFPCL